VGGTDEVASSHEHLLRPGKGFGKALVHAPQHLGRVLRGNAACLRCEGPVRWPVHARTGFLPVSPCTGGWTARGLSRPQTIEMARSLRPRAVGSRPERRTQGLVAGSARHCGITERPGGAPEPRRSAEAGTDVLRPSSARRCERVSGTWSPWSNRFSSGAGGGMCRVRVGSSRRCRRRPSRQFGSRRRTSADAVRWSRASTTPG
jgi:hypothetical protein